MLPGQMSQWQLESVLVVPKNLHFKFGQNQVFRHQYVLKLKDVSIWFERGVSILQISLKLKKSQISDICDKWICYFIKRIFFGHHLKWVEEEFNNLEWWIQSLFIQIHNEIVEFSYFQAKTSSFLLNFTIISLSFKVQAHWYIKLQKRRHRNLILLRPPLESLWMLSLIGW